MAKNAKISPGKIGHEILQAAQIGGLERTVSNMRELAYDVFQTSLGWIGVVTSNRGIRRMTLPEPSRSMAEDAIYPAQLRAVRQPKSFTELRERLERYFHGADMDINEIALDLEDIPPFFAAAWKACRSIPAGETRSYRWLAAEAGKPGALRAAGQAMARNRVPLIIPCHRVVRSDGSMGGFGGSVGLPLKRRLLQIEREASARRQGVEKIATQERDTLQVTPDFPERLNSSDRPGAL